MDAGHTAAQFGMHLLLFGGASDENRVFNDLWLFDAQVFRWRSVKVAGLVPPAKSYHTCVCARRRYTEEEEEKGARPGGGRSWTAERNTVTIELIIANLPQLVGKGKGQMHRGRGRLGLGPERRVAVISSPNQPAHVRVWGAGGV